MPIKVMTVFGTRPDAVKMAPVVLELQRYPDQFEVIVAVTGQHREMLRQVLDVFQIHPKYDLDIMQQGQTLAEITTRALEGLDKLIKQEQPDMIIAQGDTTTTFVASLAAFYNKVSFGHVEAGLRTDNKYDPFPEEMNRRLTTVIADLHFAPTTESMNNLLKEGISADKISVTGNTVIDSLISVAKQPWHFDDPVLANAGTDGKRVILVTAHRRENWGAPMASICEGVKRVVEAFPDTQVIFSAHKNPIVRDTVFPALNEVDRVHLIEPPDYIPFIHLLKSAYLVLTDSGGIQEEAPALGKPVLVMRKTTERPEGVEAGTTKLVGTDADDIFNAASELLTDIKAYNRMAHAENPYGDGNASAKIREIIINYFGLK